MALPLEDYELIRQLKYRYCRCIDTANLEELRELFVEDAGVCYIGGSYRFEVQGRKQILEAIAYAFHSEAIAFHHVNHPELKLTSPTTATGTWYLKDWFCDLRNKIVTDGSALYRDRYVKVAGEWKIEFASYERLFEIVTPFVDPPNVTAHWLAKHGRPLP